MNPKTKNSKKSTSLLLATAITFSSLVSVNTYASESSSELSLERIYGKDRYQTSIDILEKMDTNKVYLTNGKIFADALSVGPLAGKENAAIVLSDGKTLDVDKLKSKSITEITIVGGKNSISNTLENNLKKNFKVSRIAGKDRYETSLKIVEEMGVNNIAIATGRDFPDALSAGAYLSQKGMPLLLVDGSSAGNIPQKYNVVYTFGGVNSIKKTFGKRISGKNRYETSMQIAKEFGSFDTAVLASGRVFADALASTPLAKKLHAPILLTNGNDISNEVFKFQGLKKAVLVGGEKSLSKELEKKLLNPNKTEESNVGNKTSNKTYNKNNIDNSKEVVIKDEILKKAIINQLKHQNIYKDGQKITEKKMSQLKELDCNLNSTQSRSGGIKSLEGLEYAVNIKSLDLTGNEVIDLNPLKDLTKLKKLVLKNNKIKDLSPLKKLVNLEELDISNNPDTEMNLQRNQISDIKPLVDMVNLRKVKLGRNNISDASPIGKLRSKFKVAVEMGSQKVNIDTTNNLVENPIIDQSGKKLNIKEENGKIRNNGENIEILNFDKLENGKTIEVKWGKDAEFNGSLFINIKKLKEVSSVKIENTETSLEKGKSLKLKATVEGKNLKDEDKKVKFEIEGNSSSNTSIDKDGLLTIASDETSTKITVKATSVVDNTKSITKEITVTSPAKNISTKLKKGNSKSIDIDKKDPDAEEWLNALEKGKGTVLKGKEELGKLPYNFGEKNLGYHAGAYGSNKNYTGLVIFGLNAGDKVIVKVPGFEDVEIKVVNYSRPINYNLEIVQKNN